jgi:cysteine synthase A
MAAHVMRRGYERGELEPGDLIAECSSGNTGISFAALGKALGHPVRIFMPDWMSPERRMLIEAFGAEVVGISREQGGFLGGVAAAQRCKAERARVFLPRQFDNQDNVEAHELGTGEEIVDQLARLGLLADAFVAGVGTGGTVMGVGRRLRRGNPKCRVHALEPASSPTLRTGRCVGRHRIQGISDEFVPSIVRLEELDHVVDAHDGDAILMAQKMARKLGLAVGISSGANVVGAIQLAEELGPDAVVVTVLPDSNKKYLSTDLCRAEPPREDYWTPRVVLESFTALR